ncbi:hypothetical protein HAX54_021830, partial [Datura stramonium]|nr:hypothetical protein [Datura stramonium]
VLPYTWEDQLHSPSTKEDINNANSNVADEQDTNFTASSSRGYIYKEKEVNVTCTPKNEVGVEVEEVDVD